MQVRMCRHSILVILTCSFFPHFDLFVFPPFWLGCVHWLLVNLLHVTWRQGDKLEYSWICNELQWDEISYRHHSPFWKSVTTFRLGSNLTFGRSIFCRQGGCVWPQLHQLSVLHSHFLDANVFHRSLSRSEGKGVWSRSTSGLKFHLKWTVWMKLNCVGGGWDWS